MNAWIQAITVSTGLVWNFLKIEVHVQDSFFLNADACQSVADCFLLCWIPHLEHNGGKTIVVGKPLLIIGNKCSPRGTQQLKGKRVGKEDKNYKLKPSKQFPWESCLSNTGSSVNPDHPIVADDSFHRKGLSLFMNLIPLQHLADSSFCKNDWGWYPAEPAMLTCEGFFGMGRRLGWNKTSSKATMNVYFFGMGRNWVEDGQRTVLCEITIEKVFDCGII